MEKEVIIQELKDSAQIKIDLAQNDTFIEEVYSAAKIIVDAIKDGKKVLVAGNGGSAADAQHFTTELVVKFEEERKRFPAISLSANASSVTAAANDYSFRDVYSVQLESFGQQGDVFVGITTSGNSQNIISAIAKAKELGLKTIILNGRQGGKLAEAKVDANIIVTHNATKRIQEVHITIIHIWCTYIESLFRK